MAAMGRRLRRALATALLLAVVAAPAGAADYGAVPRNDPSGWHKAWDVVGLRPFDFGALVMSAAFFALAYPVTLVTGGSDFVREVCWDLPFERTFKRPLGEL